MKTQHTCFALITLVLSACENPDSTPELDTQPDIPEFPPSTEVLEPDSTLLSRLYTERESGGTTEHWYCSSSLTEIPVAYLFPGDAAGDAVKDSVNSGIYVAIHPGQGFEASFSYELLDDQTVLLDYADQPVQETLSDIQFEGSERWSGESSTDASLMCESRKVSVPAL